MIDAPTIVEILCRRIEAGGDSPALAIKCGGQYQWLTWNELPPLICSAVAALVQLGVKHGDRVVQIAENRLEWIVVDFAIQMSGAIHVPIHPTLAGPQIAWQIRHSGAKVGLLSNSQQAAKLAALGDDCPADVTWVSYDPCAELLGGQPIRTLADLQAAADVEQGVEVACQTRASGVSANSLATVLYTSGTTGEPKGVMLSQGNLASNAVATVRAFGCLPEKVRLNFLPLSHVFARTCDLYCWLVEGSKMAVAESRETVIADCQAIKPSYLNGVPHFYDRVYRGLASAGKRDTPGAVRAILGGAIEQCCAGGAALPEYLYDYFHSQDVPLLQGYGLSESSPVITLSSPAASRRSSCGRAIPGIEIAIADDGEILTRGPHVMLGYYQNPQATAEVLRDGWLATGDLGRVDDEGFLYITGRKKEIIVTLGGKNIAPAYLESLLTQDPLILQAMVVGDGRPCLAALIVPNYDILLAEVGRRGITVTTPERIMTHRDVLSLFQERIDARLADVSAAEQVRCFALLRQPFTIEAGELTPKLTLRRQEIAARHAAAIERLYR